MQFYTNMDLGRWERLADEKYVRAELECFTAQNSSMPPETVRKSPCTPEQHQTLG